MTDTPNSVASSSRPSAHSQRYDRQLRLWASSGQASLEKSNILIIGANSLSSQIIKNLVLPGVGSFTILDDANVDPADMGVNFFLQPGQSQGRSAAQEMASLLSQLNENVEHNFKIESPQALLASKPGYFRSFSLVISVNQPPEFDLALSDLLWSIEPPRPQVPLLKIRSSGMVAEMTIDIKELGIVETHPDSIIDLRLTNPFPELVAFAESFNLATTDSLTHSHIPFVVILLKKLEEWKAKNGGSPPSTKSREEFVTLINSSRQPGNLDEENFDEAIAALGKHVWRPLSSDHVGAGGVPSEIRELFKDARCEVLSSHSTNFWLMVRALRDFVDNSPTKSLPLTGSLPDMKSLSATYVGLQNVYRNKATEDLETFTRILGQVCVNAGVRGGSGAIDEDEIQAFVKHAGYLKLIRGRSERERRERPRTDAVTMAFLDPVNPCTFQHHIAFRASDLFYLKHARYPGSSRTFSRNLRNQDLDAQGRSRGSKPDHGADGGGGEGEGEGDPRKAKRSKSNESDEMVANGEAAGVGAGSDVEMAVETCVNHEGHGEEEEEEEEEEKEEEEPCFEEDVRLLAKEAESVIKSLGISTDGEEMEKIHDSLKEMVRSGHCSLPPTTALMGGVVAQEAIKILTRQYVPADDLVIYDGIQQALGVFKL
ncbi:hypothetical protein IE53DRAFT_372780 [Violaceomyces palustris]|uniref:Uncharacterized protein n=1 Tax=Violaceomyces palustris TaxID=1673888 RepID=A0ACD0P7I0_9BASI|nr:hypothetical protein IE53DRAFT_372780 [Violaceomyces palustris]